MAAVRRDLRGNAVAGCLLCLLGSVVLASGCAPQQQPPRAESSTSPPPSSPSGTPETPEPSESESPLPTLTSASRPPGGPSDQVKPLTVSGTVQEGVEPGCVVLVADDTQVSYVLVGAMARRLEMGSSATVRGLPDPNLVSTCNEGASLRVREILSD